MDGKFKDSLSKCVARDVKTYGRKGLLRKIKKEAAKGPSLEEVFDEEVIGNMKREMSKSILVRYRLRMIEAGNKQSLLAYTDYPLTDEEVREAELEDKRLASLPEGEASSLPIIPGKLKRVTVVSYDRDKYCLVIYKGAAHLVKSGYLYDTRLIKRNYNTLNGFYYEPLGRKVHELPYLVNEDMNGIEALKLLFHGW